MEPIPMPDLLDDDEQVLGCRDDVVLTRRALGDACAYGQQLWHELDAVRTYLLETSDGGRARPAGPGDDAGWDRWMAMYSSVLSTLEGPRGDSGYAWDEARTMAGVRRDPRQPGPEAARGGD